jgi:hypothetical protein
MDKSSVLAWSHFYSGRVDKAMFLWREYYTSPWVSTEQAGSSVVAILQALAKAALPVDMITFINWCACSLIARRPRDGNQILNEVLNEYCKVGLFTCTLCLEAMMNSQPLQ